MLLNHCKTSFCFSGSHLPPPANSHRAFGNQRILPHKNKIRAIEPETWRDMGATNYGRGGGGRWLETSVASPLHWSPENKCQTQCLNSSCRRRSGSEVAAILVTPLMSGNVTLSGFVTADS